MTRFRISSVLLLLLVLISLVLGSCTARKFVPNGKHLIKANEIILEKKNTSISKSDLSDFITAKPNRSFLGSRFKLWAWYVTENRTDRRFWNWVHNHVGIAPVYYDQMTAKANAEQMQRYLKDIGFMKASVLDDVELSNRFARQRFYINPSWPYTIERFDRLVNDTVLAAFEKDAQNESLVIRGDILNTYTLSDERDRITMHFKNKGYYYFSSDNIRFEVDTNFRSRQARITMKVEDQKTDRTDSQGLTIQTKHKRYFINQVSIYPVYNPFSKNSEKTDTISLGIFKNNDLHKHQQYFVFQGDPRIKLKRFGQVIHINDNQPFSLTSVKDTYRGLSNFRIYGSTNISFDTLIKHKRFPDDGRNWLDCNILLQRNKASGYSFELEGTNSSGDLGIKGNATFQNKNIFKGSEQFRFRAFGGFEMQQIRTTTEEIEARKVFNTTEVGIDASVFFPRFLSPFRLGNFVRDYQPKTNITTGLNSQNRINYSRFITNLSFGYDWMASPTLRHALTVININSVKVDPSTEFQAILDQEVNQRIKDQYSNHLIFGLKYSFIYNNQNINKLNDFIYFRANVETSGNALSLFNPLLPLDTLFDRRNLLGIAYAQFFRFDFDFRYYRVLTENNRLVFRVLVGSGLPYGNSDEMPFERSFYAGGANGMRGWQFRELGPGSYNGTENVERIGDIQLEGSFEYRFPIYSFLKGALFTDVGNIWTITESSYLPGGKFEAGQFYNELAMDAGLGLRFDFSFFIFRADFALPLRDPSLEIDHRWIINKLQFSDTRFNFGIGYPF